MGLYVLTGRLRPLWGEPRVNRCATASSSQHRHFPVKANGHFSIPHHLAAPVSCVYSCCCVFFLFVIMGWFLAWPRCSRPASRAAPPPSSPNIAQRIVVLVPQEEGGRCPSHEMKSDRPLTNDARGLLSGAAGDGSSDHTTHSSTRLD